MRLGQFLFTILIALVLFALIGIVDWSTVGDWALIMLVLALMGPILLIISYLVLKVKDNSEVINRRLGVFFNWVIVISGFVVFILVVSSQINTDDSYQDTQYSSNEQSKPNQSSNLNSSNSTGSTILERPPETEKTPYDDKVSGRSSVKKTTPAPSYGDLSLIESIQKLIPKYQGYEPQTLADRLIRDQEFFKEVATDAFISTRTEEERQLESEDLAKLKQEFTRSFYKRIVQESNFRELEQRIKVEIRDTHILIVHLFQTEINGEIVRSGSLKPMYFHGENRILAQSVAKTRKNLEVIIRDVRNTLDRVEPNAIDVEQGIPWSDHPTNSNEKWSYWVITDPTSKAKIYFEIMYKVREKEIVFTSYSYDF